MYFMNNIYIINGVVGKNIPGSYIPTIEYLCLYLVFAFMVVGKNAPRLIAPTIACFKLHGKYNRHRCCDLGAWRLKSHRQRHNNSGCSAVLLNHTESAPLN